ncbi:MAG: DUF2079 domain-containing protein [Oligoflexales bacterium]|nr:DUF2079 domain-containing protein [Oligoflexales bacterium]
MPTRKLAHLLPFLYSLIFVLPLAFGNVHKELAHIRNWHYLATLISLPILIGLWRKREGQTFHFHPLALRWAGTGLLVLFCGSVISKYFAVGENGIDFSIFDWMLVNTARSKFMYSPIYRVYHMGIHPSWILLPLVPLKVLITHPIFLSLISAFVLWASTFMLWKLARTKELDELTTALLVLAYGTCSFLGTVVNGGFRIEVFIPLFTFSFLYFWETRQTFRSLLALLLLLSVKEDTALYAGGFLLGEWIQTPLRRRLAGFGFLLAMTTLLVNLFWVQPYFLAQSHITQAEYLKFWGHYGGSKNEILIHMLTSPLQIASDILSSGWWKLYLPLLLLPLFEFSTLMASLAGICLLGTAASYPVIHQYGQYYSLGLLCFAFFGLVRKLSEHVSLRRLIQPVLLLFPLLFVGYVQISPIDWTAYKELQDLRHILQTEFKERPICAQGIAFPYLGYELDLEPLDEQCLARKDSIAVLVLNKDPFPYTKSTLDSMVTSHPEAILHRIGENYLLRGSALPPP